MWHAGDAVITERPRRYIAPSRRPEVQRAPVVGPRLTRFAVDLLAGIVGGLLILGMGILGLWIGGML